MHFARASFLHDGIILCAPARTKQLSTPSPHTPPPSKISILTLPKTCSQRPVRCNKIVTNAFCSFLIVLWVVYQDIFSRFKLARKQVGATDCQQCFPPPKTRLLFSPSSLSINCGRFICSLFGIEPFPSSRLVSIRGPRSSGTSDSITYSIITGRNFASLSQLKKLLQENIGGTMIQRGPRHYIPTAQNHVAHTLI